MKNLPLQIFLNLGDEEDVLDYDFDELAEVTWCKEPIFKHDVPYARSWISVKDEMPLVTPSTGESDWVITIDARQSIKNPSLPRIGKYSIGLYSNKGWHSTCIGEKLYGITHWMPIPKITE